MQELLQEEEVEVANQSQVVVVVVVAAEEVPYPLEVEEGVEGVLRVEGVVLVREGEEVVVVVVVVADI